MANDSRFLPSSNGQILLKASKKMMSSSLDLRQKVACLCCLFYIRYGRRLDVIKLCLIRQFHTDHISHWARDRFSCWQLISRRQRSPHQTVWFHLEVFQAICTGMYCFLYLLNSSVAQTHKDACIFYFWGCKTCSIHADTDIPSCCNDIPIGQSWACRGIGREGSWAEKRDERHLF